MKISRKYNIAFLGADYPPNQGGVANYSINLAKVLALKNHNVRVIAPHVSGDRELDIENPLSVTRIGDLDIGRKRLGLFNRFRSVQKSHRQLNEWFSRKYDDNLPDFAVVSTVSVWANVCYQKNIPYVVCVHGADAFGLRSDFIRTMYRKFAVKLIFKRAKLICANSDYTASFFSQRARMEKKIITTYCGVDIDLIAAIKKYSDHHKKPGDGKRLLMMCRFEPIKACNIAIEAVSCLKKKYPDIQLTIAGDGQLRAELERQVQNLGISDNVHFVGYVKKVEQKIKLFFDSDLLIQTGRLNSRGLPAETFGIVFAEAGMCCRPVIGPRVGGVPEVIEHGKTGYLIEPNNVNSLVKAIDDIISDPEKGKEMGLNGNKRVSKMFNYDRIAKMIVDRMASIINSK